VILDHNSMQNAATDAQRSGALQTSNEVYRKLKEDLLRSRRAVNVLMGADAAKVNLPAAHYTVHRCHVLLSRCC
jgi:hypothetical protein